MGLENLRSVFQDLASDRADDFVTQTPSHLNSTSPIFDSLNKTNLVNLETNKKSGLPFPQNYKQINTLVNGEFKSVGDGLKNHGWPDLYNANHTSIDINKPKPRSENPFQPFSYGNSNIRQNLDIKQSDSSFRTSVVSGAGKLINNLNFFDIGLIGSVGDFLQDMGKEPYIVSRIPKDSDMFDAATYSSGRTIQAGSRLIPLARPIVDTLRLAKYLSSPSGLKGIAEKNAQLVIPTSVVMNKDRDGLVRVPQRFNQGYNSFLTTFSRFAFEGIGLFVIAIIGPATESPGYDSVPIHLVISYPIRFLANFSNINSLKYPLLS